MPPPTYGRNPSHGREWAELILESQREQLASEAGNVIFGHPGLRLAGLIIEAGAQEGVGLRQALRAALGESFDSFTGVVPHELVAEILPSHETASCALDELLISGHPTLRILRVAIVTKSGCFDGSVVYRIPGLSTAASWS